MNFIDNFRLFESKSLYTEINLDELGDFDEITNQISISDIDIKRIKKVLDNKVWRSHSYTISVGGIIHPDKKISYKRGGGVFNCFEIYNNNSKQSYNIDKYDDGWFVVSFIFNKKHKYYKCDQIDGLVQFLKHQKVTKK